MSNIKSKDADGFAIVWTYEKRGHTEVGVDAIYTTMTQARRHMREQHPKAKEDSTKSNNYFVCYEEWYYIEPIKFNQPDMMGYADEL